MKKLVNGIIDFRKNIRPSYAETFARLALGQSPDSLFIGCSDSRVVPNLFASTDPGDLFVVRNVGNLVPPCGGEHGRSTADESEAAAIEFAVTNLGVHDIIVCGHSECGAMQALVNGREKVPMPNLKSWLRHGDKALAALIKDTSFAQHLSMHNRLSQRNVLQQVEHLTSYPIIQEKLAAKRLRIHAWWFELHGAAVHCFDQESGKFVEIDEKTAQRILRSLEA
jgi:carbonic anhydrase